RSCWSAAAASATCPACVTTSSVACWTRKGSPTASRRVPSTGPSAKAAEIGTRGALLAARSGRRAGPRCGRWLPFRLTREVDEAMPELLLTLDFACCTCDHPVGVTVKCAGKGLKAGLRTVAAVPIACPHCGVVNELYFEPSGTVRGVAPY